MPNKNTKKAILSITFNDYTKGGGGVAKVIIEQQELFNKAGYMYICIFPIKKLIFHDNIMLFCYWGILIDGQFHGVFNDRQILDKLFELNREQIAITYIHIHHLMYSNISMIQEFVDYLQDVPIIFFIHDYYSICRNYTLLRNSTEYCGLGGISREKCDGCKFYNKLTRKTLRQIEHFFTINAGRLTFVAPSEAAKEVWLSYYKQFEKKIIVVGHDRISEVRTHFKKILKYDEKIRIAFLGRPHVHKGWNVWTDILNNNFNKHYEYFVFSNEADNNKKYKHIYVNVTPQDKDAMIKALIANKIDAVLLWSTWPETYSYTYFESYCADTFVLTDRSSGNIAKKVYENGNGIVFKNEAELLKNLNNYKTFIENINAYRNDSKKIPSKMTPNDYIIDFTKKQENIMNQSFEKRKNHPSHSLLLKVVKKIYK